MAISIQSQPNSFGISYARSPIIYRFVDCISTCNYQFNLYITNESIVNLPTNLYSYVVRVPDLLNGITIDASNMIRNYIRSNIQFYTENIVYVMAELVEYSGTTLSDTIPTGIAKIGLGYNNFESSYGVFNYNEAYWDHMEDNYMLNSIQPDVPYYIPNYGYSRFRLSWKKALSICDGYRILYYGPYGVNTIYNLFDAVVDAMSEVETFFIGYYDLENYWGITDVNIAKPIQLQLMNGSTVVHNYILNPINCNGNELTNLQFMNKWGVWEHFFCYGRIDNKFENTSEIYKYNNVDYATMTYDMSEGSYHKQFSQGRNSITLNTGWLNEQQNEKMKQLLLSEFVVIDVPIGNQIPIIITNKSTKFLTNKWDKMINYTLECDYAIDEINNIT